MVSLNYWQDSLGWSVGYWGITLHLHYRCSKEHINILEQRQVIKILNI